MRSARFAIATALVLCAAGCGKADPEEHFAKGKEYLEKDMLADAIMQFRMAADADPKRGEFRAELSDAYLRNREGGPALREAVAAADLLPNDAKAQIRAGNMLLVARAFEDAKTRADKAVALEPKNVDALVLMAYALAGLKNLDGALAELQEAIALDPKGDHLYASAGALQYIQGDKEAAEATLRKAVQVAPESIRARSALAGFLWSANRAAEAEVVLKEALAIDPKDLQANRALGVFYTSTGRGAEAEPYFKTIVETANTDEAHLALADYYVGQRRYDEAAAVLTPLSSVTAMADAAGLRLAAIEVARNNPPGAERLVRTVLDRSPKYTPARLFELRLKFAQAKSDEVMTLADGLVKDAPNTPAAAEALYMIGRIEASRDRPDVALERLEEALRIAPQSAPAALAIAQIHLTALRPEKAETFAQMALRANPKNPSARALIARTKLMRNDIAGATADLASLEKDYPTALPVQNLIAARHAISGRPDQARALYAKVFAADPANLEALEGLTLLDLQAKRNSEAIARIDSALKRLPPSVALLSMAARAYASSGDPKRAEELLRDAIEKDPSRLVAYGMLGALYIRQGRLDDAADQYRVLVQRNPKSVGANTMLGMIYETRKDVAAAEKQYQQTLSIDPNAAVAANNLAWIYVASDRNLDTALQLAQVAHKALPEDPDVNDTLGWIYFRKKMFPQAVRHLEVSNQRRPNSPPTMFHLGMAYLETGDVSKARTLLKAAIASGEPFEGIDEARKALDSLERGR